MSSDKSKNSKKMNLGKQIKKYLKEKSNIGYQYEINQNKIEEDWEKIEKNPKLEAEDLDKINDLITSEGESTLKTWKRIRNFSFFFSIIFLLFIYYIFRYITDDFEIIEDSFTNIFCPL
tara:strand:+ start:2151 stop:2507 length:357 start_codon:yes stop_codon:yes gene_type:complete